MHKIDTARYWLLKGYLELLEKSPGNGATIHDRIQLITALRMSMELGYDIDAKLEKRIKDCIHRDYEMF